jgi:uncharacterized protein YrzB (UPF0473 family)
MDENMMSEEYYTLTDEEGNELKFELIGKAELKGTQYYAFIPADEESDGEFCEYTILKVTEEEGEEILVSIDDDDEFEDVADIFDDMFDEEIDLDGAEG